MFSWSSPANPRIVGIDGYSPDQIRAEVDRGARFVIYSYVISVLVMTFKRPSDIYLVPAGQSRVTKGLQFSLVSFLLGWWGLPWGIIYTIQALYTNFTGGRDVTDAVLASLAPAPSPAAVPPHVTRPARQFSARQALGVAAVLVLIAAITYPAICYFYGRELPVALVSGIDRPYSVTLNGVDYRLAPHSVTLTTVPEGEITLDSNGAGIVRTSVGEAFFKRPFQRQAVVLNPDRLAVLYQDNIHFSAAPREHPTSFTLYANQPLYVIARSDYFFVDPPRSISLPTGQSDEVRTSFQKLPALELTRLAPFLHQNLGEAGFIAHLELLAQDNPDDEKLQGVIVTELKPADARRLFESQLDVRPARIEWHRAYQFLIDRSFPGEDLKARYRAWMEAAPDDGALAYLYGRLLMTPEESRPYYERALSAARPCAYGAYGLATDEFAAGRYPEALALIERAAGLGLHSGSLSQRRRDVLLAMERYEQCISDDTRQLVADPLNEELFSRRNQLEMLRHYIPMEAPRKIDEFVSAYRAKYGQETDPTLAKRLQANVDYVWSDEPVFAKEAAQVPGSWYAFQAAVSRHDHAAAAKALSKESALPVSIYWMLALTAESAGDHAAFGRYFDQALSQLAKEDRYSRECVQRLQHDTPADHVAVRQTPNFAGELRVMFTALGVRYPAERENYFKRARELDHDPAFPHRLLVAVRGDSKK